MAAAGTRDIICNLVRDGTLELEYQADLHPKYTGLVVSGDMIIVADRDAYNVRLHRLMDGKLIALSDRLEACPRCICLINGMEICVILVNRKIEIMLVQCTGNTGIIKRVRTLHVNKAFDECYAAVKYMDKLIVSGVKRGKICWSIVSLNDGHGDTIHQICKGFLSFLTIKNNILYISCFADPLSPENGIYAYDIQNPNQPQFIYRHNDLKWPRGITLDSRGYIFVCNQEPPCFHHLTDKCELVAIYREKIPSRVHAIFWDQQHEQLYISRWFNNVITQYKHVCSDQQGPVIPMEILHMDENSLQLYKDALQDGKEKVYNIRVMVVGHYGAGKTTLIKRLLGQKVDISDRKSTEGIDVYQHCCKISLDTQEWIVQYEDSDKLSRLQRLRKLLSGPGHNPDVRQEQGHRKVIYQRETTSEVDITQNKTKATSSGSDISQVLLSSSQQPAESSFSKMDQRHGVEHLDQSTSNVAISDANFNESEKKDAVMEIIHLINANADKLEKDIVNFAALTIWDFAGQYIFYTTHQTFLTSQAIYLLVIDLSQQVADLIKDEKCFLDTEGIKLCKVYDLIEIWLNSIHSCSPSPGASIPNVILVGTHVDKLSEKSQKEVIVEYFKKLRYMLREKPVICHLMDDIAIDNTQCDPKLEQLKRRIFELASKQTHWGEEKPARWLPLEHAVMTLKASGAKVVPISLIEEINRSGSVRIENRSELELFLRFHHEMGTILYFSVEGLREKIVLDPQWMIDALKSLTTAENYMKENPAITSKFYEFKERGKLTLELIDAIWTKENNLELHNNKKHILLLMEQLNIIARPRFYTEEGEEPKEQNYFLAPCMLQLKTPEEVICPKPTDQMESSSVLSCVFVDKFLPSPIFHRLLAACVAHWPIAIKKKEEMQENMIFCGCCVFQLDQYHKLILHFREYAIFLRVTRMGIREKTPSSKLCIEVREFITTRLLKIIGYLGQSLKFEYFIQCPEYNGVSINSFIPVSLLKENAEVRCDFHDNIIESCRLLKFWFKDQELSGDAYKSKDLERTQVKGTHKVPDVLGNDEIKQPVTVETSTQTEQGVQQQEIEQNELSGSEEDQEVEGQDNDDTPITHEHINHVRLCNALTTVCADALREILLNQVPVPYANIYQAILANEINLTCKLNSDQSVVLFPDTPGTTGTVDQFDISLLYIIIRNVSSTPAPATGWGNPPVDQPRDTSLGASVERIRFSRNSISGHSVNGKISETAFKDYWQMIDDVIRDIESYIGVRGYRVQLEKRKNQPITPHEAHQLQRQFQEYKKQVEDAKEKLQMAMEAVQKL